MDSSGNKATFIHGCLFCNGMRMESWVFLIIGGMIYMCMH